MSHLGFSSGRTASRTGPRLKRMTTRGSRIANSAASWNGGQFTSISAYGSPRVRVAWTDANVAALAT
jgi:hypothetical protein